MTDRRPSGPALSALVAGGRSAERRHGALSRYLICRPSVGLRDVGCQTSVVKVVSPRFPGREVNGHRTGRSAKAQQAQHLGLHAVPEGRRRVVCPRALRGAARTWAWATLTLTLTLSLAPARTLARTPTPTLTLTLALTPTLTPTLTLTFVGVGAALLVVGRPTSSTPSRACCSAV